MNRLIGRAIARLGLALLGVVTGNVAVAADGTYPDRPVRLIVGVPPGGASDLVGRAIAKGLSEQFSQPVVVENLSGNAGVVAMDRLSRSASDGYTLGLGNAGPNVVMPATGKATYDPVNGFTPLGMVASGPQFVVAFTGLGVRSIAELVAIAKSRPGKLNWAVQGIGGQTHLTSAAFERRAGIKVTFVPYNGSAPVALALRRGEVDVTLAPVDLAKLLVDSGAGVLLAVASDKRLANMPDLPTLAETYPDIVSTAWWGVFGPPGMSPAVANKLQAAIRLVAASPEYQQQISTVGLGATYMNGDDLGRTIRSEVATWSSVAKEIGLNIE